MTVFGLFGIVSCVRNISGQQVPRIVEVYMCRGRIPCTAALGPFWPILCDISFWFPSTCRAGVSGNMSEPFRRLHVSQPHSLPQKIAGICRIWPQHGSHTKTLTFLYNGPRPCSCRIGGCGWQRGLCARRFATWKHPISQACSCQAQHGDWEWLGFAADFSRRRGLGTVLQPCDCGPSACWRGGSQAGTGWTDRWGDPGKGLRHPLGLHH